MSYELKQNNLLDRIFICETLQYNEIELFLERLILGNGKWIIYENNTQVKKNSKMCSPTSGID